MTVADKLVLAAATLDEGEGINFSAEDLVVAAWRCFPDTFGLRGHLDADGNPQFPDSNRVFAEIMGTKPVRAQGFIEKTGSRRYALTAAGRAQAARLNGATSTGRKSQLNLKSRQALEKYLKSRAFLKVKAGRADELSFNDAAGFWGISARSRLKDLVARRAEIRAVVADARHSLGGESTASLEHAGSEFSQDDLLLLEQVDGLLAERFADELAVITERRTER